ncbi:hypothetical protein Tco_1126375 [Tanacetum coccineum]
MEESLSKFMAESAKRHDENSNSIKEILAATDATIINQGASITTLEIQIGKISKIRRIDPTEHDAYIQADQSTIPFLSWLTDDYEKMDLLDSATYMKSFLKEKLRIGYQIEPSIYMNDSAILEETLPPKKKTQGVLLYLVILIIFVLKMP